MSSLEGRRGLNDSDSERGGSDYPGAAGLRAGLTLPRRQAGPLSTNSPYRQAGAEG